MFPKINHDPTLLVKARNFPNFPMKENETSEKSSKKAPTAIPREKDPIFMQPPLQPSAKFTMPPNPPLIVTSHYPVYHPPPPIFAPQDPTSTYLFWRRFCVLWYKLNSCTNLPPSSTRFAPQCMHMGAT